VLLREEHVRAVMSNGKMYSEKYKLSFILIITVGIIKFPLQRFYTSNYIPNNTHAM
jgi:hypothetical protein